ncbi:MAG: beta-ketoacyl-ACP synthase III [Phycisphaerae bacterium]|nr:beta-ketoacyl-ACP synthase III [Phycisphaerae bacterium]
MPSANWTCGVRIAGTGSAVPDRILSNADFEKIVDTSDEWIFQRTGIRERRISDPSKEGTTTLSRDALNRALESSGIAASELDLIICGTCTQEMTCPSTACRVAAAVGATPAAAFDLVAACSGFVYSLNVAESLIRSGRHKKVGVVGCDAMSSIIDYCERGTSILFGDAAGAAILVRDENPSRGCIYQHLGADGRDWRSLYIPRRPQDVPPDATETTIRLGYLRMDGREVFKFAVTKFRQVIEDAMAKTGLGVDDVGLLVCHQSNIRIIEAAREKIGLRRDQVFTNIERYGNSSAGSVGLCLDQVWKAGLVPCEKPIILVAFGGGMTWASSVWRF